MMQFATPPSHEPGSEARLERIMEEFRAGFDLLDTVDKAITYFGSHVTAEGDPLYEKARTLASRLAKLGFTTVTGGGPGIMEAANRGAFEADGRSIGFNLMLNKEPENRYTKERVVFYYLFVRKVMLASAGSGYVFFPGGFGTLDEFFEISTLIHTHKLHHDIPVVLIDKEYWGPLMEWLEAIAIAPFQAFNPIDMNLWTLVDTIEEAQEEIVKNALSQRLHT